VGCDDNEQSGTRLCLLSAIADNKEHVESLPLVSKMGWFSRDVCIKVDVKLYSPKYFNTADQWEGSRILQKVVQSSASSISSETTIIIVVSVDSR